MGVIMFWTSIVLACSMFSLVAANWDPATGHLKDHVPSKQWLAKNPATIVTKEIQVSECAKNTRLHYPKVQLFAVFTVNHDEDNYHGCPYGDCHAFTVAPEPKDMEPAFTDAHSFFWHQMGGWAGDGTKPISDPQNGAFGYEESITGKFKDGPLDTTSLQLDHDGNYPGFDSKSLKRWTPEEIDQFSFQKDLPKHPKCGVPCGPNRDPGSAPGAFGHWKPYPASAYSPPPTWKPTSHDQCFKNGTGGGYTGYNGTSGVKPNGTRSGSGGNGNDTRGGTGGGGKNTHPLPGGSGNATRKAGSPHVTNPKHSSGNHCKSYCQCLQGCAGNNCDVCNSKNKNQCTKDDCAKYSARGRRCL